MANTPVCPTCGEPGVPIVYGLPTRGARAAASAGKLRLMGCKVPLEPDRWACPQRHTWRSGDDGQLRAAIDAALRED
ncbi:MULTISPECIES: hypothetical protein [Kribbella]|uniref:Uncharacterized protein n=1 Tax=Kribbella karoonensis TaxID=324851 RepID=A0ABN2DFK9_9ACTN